MKIAIIEEDQGRLKELDSLISGHEWDVDFFRTPQEFGRVDLSGYDIVVADCSLPTMHGRDLIKSLAGKTEAQMLLMSDSTNVFSQEDIENENINGFIDSTEQLIDQLGYFDSKIRINKLMEQESDRINGILANGFSLSVKGDIGVMEIKNLPVNATMKRMESEILEAGIKCLVVCFAVDILNSAHLGVLVSLYKRLKSHKIKMAYWNKSGSPYTEKLMKGSNLDNLYGIYSDLDMAIKSLSE